MPDVSAAGGSREDGRVRALSRILPAGFTLAPTSCEDGPGERKGGRDRRAGSAARAPRDRYSTADAFAEGRGARERLGVVARLSIGPD